MQSLFRKALYKDLVKKPTDNNYTKNDNICKRYTLCVY